MRRYLLAALWPAGLAVIAAATVMAAQRPPAPRGRADADDPGGPGSGQQGGAGDEAAWAATPPAGATGPAPGQPGRPARDLLRLGAIAGAGGVLSYGAMTLLGPTIVNHGPAIDEPVFRWISNHQVDWWAAVMERFNKIGNTWTIWGAAGAAAACLGASWRRQKWLPPAALGAAVLVDKYVTLALRRRFGRPGPPGSPGGTYPSGGCDRVIFFYGLVANMLWREFSGSYRGKIWSAGGVAALAFNVAYCRAYLSKHWFSDILTGLVYGGLLLAPFLAAVRLIAGPPRVTAGDDPAPVTAPQLDPAA